jgi:FkbM family methyltransferase
LAFSLRHLAERLSRNVTFRARLPKRFGRRPIWLSPGNHLAVLKPGDAKFEAYLLGFAERFVDPGSVAWDIGANMGMFSLPAATRARFTLAIEPDPFNLLLLQRSMADNPDLKIDVLPAALSNQFGTAKFNIPVRGRSANGFAETAYGSQTGGVREQFSVLTVTADWALDHYPAPDFIKCDAEGAETLILKGASRLLADIRPVWVIEMPNANAEACAALFKANDYVMLSSYPKVSRGGIVDDIHDVWDVLAIPAEKFDQFEGR